MKKLFVLLAVVLCIACEKESVSPEECYTCTDIEAIYDNGRLISSRSIATYTIAVVPKDTTETVDPKTGLITLRYMECQKK